MRKANRSTKSPQGIYALPTLVKVLAVITAQTQRSGNYWRKCFSSGRRFKQLDTRTSDWPRVTSHPARRVVFYIYFLTSLSLSRTLVPATVPRLSQNPHVASHVNVGAPFLSIIQAGREGGRGLCGVPVFVTYRLLTTRHCLAESKRRKTTTTSGYPAVLVSKSCE